MVINALFVEKGRLISPRLLASNLSRRPAGFARHGMKETTFGIARP
jgi:hypothetical protein